MRVNVVCDFDGTIALEDVTDGLLERFAHSSWKHIEAQWLAGKIGSRECMARQVSLIEASYKELNRYLDAVQIDPSFPSFVADCERSVEIALNVVSDGIDYAARRILDQHQLSRLRVKANTLVALADNRYRLEFPYSVADCEARAGTCKCAIVQSRREASQRYVPVVLIGDGRSDFCAASSVDFVFAKDRLLAYCRDNAIPHLPFDTFSDVERRLERVVDTLARSVESAHFLTGAPE